MSAQTLWETFETLAQTPGLLGCALLEAQSGMVWHHAGDVPGLQRLAEASSDYWRLSRRLNEHLDRLGPIQAGVLIHTRGRVTLLPCGPDMLLLALTDVNPTVDWRQWQQKVRKLAELVADF